VEIRQGAITQLQQKLTQNESEKQKVQQELTKLQQEQQDRIALDIMFADLEERERRNAKYNAEYLELLEEDNKGLEQKINEQLVIHNNEISSLKAEIKTLENQLRQSKQFQNISDITNSNHKKTYSVSIKYINDFDDVGFKGIKGVVKKVLSLQDNPRPNGYELLKQSNSNVYRIRAGEYRICYTIDESVTQSSGEVKILIIAPRDDVYSDLKNRIN